MLEPAAILRVVKRRSSAIVGISPTVVQFFDARGVTVEAAGAGGAMGPWGTGNPILDTCDPAARGRTAESDLGLDPCRGRRNFNSPGRSGDTWAQWGEPRPRRLRCTHG